MTGSDEDWKSSHNDRVIRSMVQKKLDKGEREAAFKQAIRYRLTDLIDQFLADGIPVNWQNRRGSTALMTAANGANHRLVKRLLDLGADVHIRDAQGGTALIYAVSGLNRETNVLKVVKMLLEAGADKTIVNNSGRTPCFFARSNYSDEIVALLCD